MDAVQQSGVGLSNRFWPLTSAKCRGDVTLDISLISLVLTCTLAYIGYGSTCWILARSAGDRCSWSDHQPEFAKEKATVRSSVPCLFKPHCVPNCGDDSRIPQAASSAGGKRALQLKDLVGVVEPTAVGAWPRFAQLASDDSYCGTFPVPANHHATSIPFAFACPRSLDHAQTVFLTPSRPSRVPSRRVVDPPGTGLEAVCLCSRLRYRFRLFRFTIPEYHQPLTGH